MSTLYVTEPHALVKKDGDTLIVQIPEERRDATRPLAEGEGAQEKVEIERGKKMRVVRVPLVKVDQVVVFGDVTLTAPALHALLENHVEVCFLSQYGNFIGRLSPEFSKNSLVRLEQHRAHDDPQRALALAKQCVWGKLSNLRTLLMRANRKLENPEIEQAVAALKGIVEKVERFEAENARAQEPDLSHVLSPSAPLRVNHALSEGNVSAEGEACAEPCPEPFGSAQGKLRRRGSRSIEGKLPTNPAVAVVNDLLGLEGMGSSLYFGVFGKLLKQDWGFNGRSKRPPTDPVNAMLSYGYTLLMHKVQSAIGVVGLDPYVGFLHSSQYGKPALALDLMEEFRGPIVDSVVITLVNTGALKREDFVEEVGTYRMNDTARRTFLEKFEERLNTLIEHPTFGYKATYQRCLELQTRLLAKSLTGEIPGYPPFLVR